MSNGQNVCFTCRISFKQGSLCPSCGGKLRYMGTKFKAPRKSNELQWRKILLMIEATDRYRQKSKDCHVIYCPEGCHIHPWTAIGRGVLPRWGKPAKTVADVKTHLHLRRSRTRVYAP
jgi:hypothetical protein